MNEIAYLILCGILVIPALIFAYIKTGKKLNIVSFIAVWYSFWCIISCTEICEYAVEFGYGRLYIMSNILVLIYILTLTIRNSAVKEKTKQEPLKSEQGYVATSQLVDIARMLVLIFECYFLGVVVLRLLQGNLTIYTLRTAAYSSGEGALFSSLAGNIYFVFIKGFVIFDTIFEITQIINGKRRPKVLPIINLFLFCLITLNRVELVRTAILIVLCVVISGKSVRETLNRSRVVRKLVGIFAIAVAVLVLLRFIVKDTSDGIIQSVLNTIFTDFSIPFVTFNYFFEQYLDGVRIVDCSIFDILFSGLLKILEPLLNIFGVDVFNFNGYLAEKLDYAIDVGRDKVLKTNAFYTMYYNFVNGGGLVVPYFVSAVFGWLLGFLYNRWQRIRNNRNFALLIFVAQVVIFGLLRWEMYAHWSWTTLFLLLIFTGKRKVKLRFTPKNSFKE